MRVATYLRQYDGRLRVAREVDGHMDGLRRLSIQRLLATLALDASVQLLQPLSERIEAVILQTEVCRLCQTTASLRHVTCIGRVSTDAISCSSRCCFSFQLALLGQ